MKARTLGLTLALSLVAGGTCFADPLMGTWKLIEAKSILDPASGKNTTVIYAPAGGSVKIVVEGVDKEGKATHNEWLGKFDGQDYPIKGDTYYESRAYTKANDRTLEIAIKKDGNVVMLGKVMISPDSQIRTVITSGANPEGKKARTKSVYEKTSR